MGDLEGLIDKVNELKLDENEELIDKLKQGIKNLMFNHITQKLNTLLLGKWNKKMELKISFLFLKVYED